jgi:DNA-binding NarL/FixJ family response regulator
MRILIVDDHPVYAEGLRNLLRSRDYLDVEVANDGAAAIATAAAWKPEVILMDIGMPGMDGIEATRLIKEADGEVKIIILTSLGDSDSLIEAVKAGASGYLVKSLDGDELIDCFESLREGKNPFSAGLGDMLLDEVRRSTAAPPLDRGDEGLGARGRTILGFLAEGLSYKEIGAKLSLSERTIKYHIVQVKKILGLESKAQLVDYWRAKVGS